MDGSTWKIARLLHQNDPFNFCVCVCVLVDIVVRSSGERESRQTFGVSIETVKVGCWWGRKTRARKARTLRGTVSCYYYYYYYVDDTHTNTRGCRIVGVYQDARGRVVRWEPGSRPPPFCPRASCRQNGGALRFPFCRSKIEGGGVHPIKKTN